MQRQILQGKIHRATVTEARIDYEGSLTVDPLLLEAADIVEHEKVLIANLNTGARIESYCISGERGSGVICLNGGAAKHAGFQARSRRFRAVSPRRRSQAS